jgi:putative DNA primase/helicase
LSDLRAIARALGGEVAGLDQVLAPGPGHRPKDRSLSVRLSQHAPEGFIVHSYAGDHWRDCRDHVRSLLGITLPSEHGCSNTHQSRSQKPSRCEDSEDARRIARALKLWDEGRDPQGTLVERYLTGRKADGGRALDFPHDCAGRVLRFHPECPWRDEAL